MSDEWNTVNIRPGKGGVLREIDLLRRRYHEHRTTLERLATDAPTEHLAGRYRELIAELDASMARIADLEMGGTEPPPPPRSPASTQPIAAPYDMVEPERGQRPLRLFLLLAAGIAAVALLGWLAWSRAGGESAPPEPVRTTPVVETTATAPVTDPPLAEDPMTIQPAAHDYGSVGRGARAARQFEIANNTDEPLAIQVRRAECRCLWFEYADTIPPRGTATLTVTVDGSKAPPGPLRQRVDIVSATDPGVAATFEVTAAIGP